MQKSNLPRQQAQGAYPTILVSLNWYNYSSPVKKSFIFHVQLIFSIVELFSPLDNFMYLESI